MQLKIIIKYILCSVFLLVCRVHSANTQFTSDVPVDPAEINRQPWQSYQKLNAFEIKNSTLTGNSLLMLLLRKAQAENLLYFFKRLEKTVNKAQQLVTPYTPVEITSQLNVYAGLVAQRNGFYALSVTLFNKAIKQATNANLLRIYIMAKSELAYTRSLSELYETSLNEIQKAYVEAFTLGDQFLLANINETYGAIYGYLKEYDKSIEYYEKALDSYERLGYQAHIAEAIYGMASTYRYWGKYDLAIAKFKLYIQKISYTPNTDISFFGHYGLGMSLAEKGSCIQALVIINTALTLHGQVDYNAELYKRKASCLIELGRLGEAKQALDAAKKIFISIPELTNTRWQLEVLKISANLAHAYHDDKQAYLLMNEFHQKSTKLQLKNSSERLIKVRSALEIDRRDTEISLLHQRAKVQALLMEKKRQQVNSQHYFIIVIVIFIILILIFLLAQHKYTRRLLAISVHDSLSGLFNRKYIFDFLEKTITATSLKKGNLAVILLDIDDFKHANDHYGHSFGDQVIKQISTICQTTLRNEDVVGRIGGEEFLCVLPRTDQRESKRIAQRMLYNIAQHSFLTKSGEYYSTTVSIGIANITPKTSNSTELYVQADKALYHAKHLGKNLIISYQNIADKVG